MSATKNAAAAADAAQEAANLLVIRNELAPELRDFFVALGKKYNLNDDPAIARFVVDLVTSYAATLAIQHAAGPNDFAELCGRAWELAFGIVHRPDPDVIAAAEAFNADQGRKGGAS